MLLAYNEMTMIAYTNYTDEEYDELIELLKSCDLYDEPWETRENLKLKIERDPASIILAVDDKQVVGCVFIVVDGWIGMIWRLAVLDTYRKQGIGHELMQRAEILIKNRGVKESSIFVATSKEDLKDWYQKQNYTKTSDFTFMYKEL